MSMPNLSREMPSASSLSNIEWFLTTVLATVDWCLITVVFAAALSACIQVVQNFGMLDHLDDKIWTKEEKERSQRYLLQVFLLQDGCVMFATAFFILYRCFLSIMASWIWPIMNQSFRNSDLSDMRFYVNDFMYCCTICIFIASIIYPILCKMCQMTVAGFPSMRII